MWNLESLTRSSFVEYEQGTIRCKIQENVAVEEHGFRRRDVIQGLGLAVGMVRSLHFTIRSCTKGWEQYSYNSPFGHTHFTHEVLDGDTALYLR